jgi:thymidylate synthase
MWNQRSVDTFLGLPFNIASYGLLLELLAKEVNMIAGGLIGNLGDTHLYLNHIEQAEEQLDRVPFELPKLKLSNVDILSGEFKAELLGYKHHPKIKASLSN